MKHWERMLTALEGGMPDRLPATIHGWMDFWNTRYMNGIEIGLDGLQALQPTCRGMEPEKLKDEFGDRIMLMGSIDTQLIIETSPDLVRAETRRVLEIMKPGGGYIASPSHDYVLPETPVEDVLAVYRVIREYGGYN